MLASVSYITFAGPWGCKYLYLWAAKFIFAKGEGFSKENDTWAFHVSHPVLYSHVEHLKGSVTRQTKSSCWSCWSGSVSHVTSNLISKVPPHHQSDNMPRNLFSNNTSYDEAFFETVKSCVKGYENEMNVMQSMNVDVDLSSMNRDITLE